MMTEADTCRKYVPPKLIEAGWDNDPHSFTEQKTSTDGRLGSHRYLTCVPTRGAISARFVCFHLLTPEGLHDIGEASPGSADKNRTLNTKALLEIPIPVPSYEKQPWLDELYEKVDQLKKLEAETAVELDALVLSILDKVFKGDL